MLDLFISFGNMKVRSAIKGFLLVVYIWILATTAYSQRAQVTLPFTRYTVANGLAQMQIRSIFIDHDGLVWIGTQGGLSIFDGNDMRTLNNVGFLAEEYIVNLMRATNSLYISTHTSNYAYNGNEFGSPDSTYRFSYDTYVQFEDLYHNIWYHTEHRSWSIKDPEGNIIPLGKFYPELSNLKITGAWGGPNSESCYLFDSENKFYAFNFVSRKLTVDSITLHPTDKVSLPGNHSPDLSKIFIKKFKADGKTISGIYKISEHKLVLVTESKDGTMRAVSLSAPLGFVQRIGEVNTLFILMDSIYVTDALPHFNSIRFVVEGYNKLFVATDEGFVVVHGDGLQNVIYPPCDYAWSVVPGDYGEIYFGCYKTGVHRLDAEGRLIQHYLLPTVIDPGKVGDQILTNYLVTPDAYLWGSNSGFIALKKTENSLIHVSARGSVEAMAADPSNGHVIAGSVRLEWIDSNLTGIQNSAELPDQIMSGAFVNDMVVDNDHILWIAAPGGIGSMALHNKATEVYTFSDNKLPCQGAVSVKLDQHGNIWSGGTCGLLKYNASNDLFESILPDIIQHRINQLTFIPGNRLVCTSNNNLYVLDVSADEPSIMAMYTARNGLNLLEPSENGSSITGNRYVWLPSVAGIQRLDLLRIPKDTIVPRLKVIRINDRTVLSLNNRPDTMTIEGFAALTELSLIDYGGRSWEFRFSVNNGDFSPWQASKEFLLSGFRHGYNHIRFRAAWDKKNMETVVEKDIVIKAHLPFLSRSYVQWSLVALSIVLICLVATAIIRGQRSRQREHALRSDLYRNRLRTIQAYLNPHFLFNTLTSIQDRILQHDAKSGNDLIMHLARVFRKVLDTGKSGDQSIPLVRLSEELDLINDMVYLNNAQLNDPVQVVMDIDRAVKELDPLIPPLMIQPFVENAFKHAFEEAERNKIIHVRIRLEGEELTVLIKDNGKGYDLSQGETENSTMGLFLANERMLILNQLDIENSITIHPEQPHGTSVEISLKLQT